MEVEPLLPPWWQSRKKKLLTITGIVVGCLTVVTVAVSMNSVTTSDKGESKGNPMHCNAIYSLVNSK